MLYKPCWVSDTSAWDVPDWLCLPQKSYNIFAGVNSTTGTHSNVSKNHHDTASTKKSSLRHKGYTDISLPITKQPGDMQPTQGIPLSGGGVSECLAKAWNNKKLRRHYSPVSPDQEFFPRSREFKLIKIEGFFKFTKKSIKQNKKRLRQWMQLL